MKGFALVLLALLVAGCVTEKSAMTSTPPPMPADKPRAAPPPPPPPPPPAAPVKPAAPRVVATGEYMDNQESELRKRIGASGVVISRLGDDIVISMSNDFLFDSSSGVSWDASDVLNSIADVLNHYDQTNVEIGGYTDTTGAADANLRVSQTRAGIVADALQRDGVAQARIATQGFGETHLRVPTGNDVSQKRNRRVEIRIVPKTQT